MRNKHPMAHHVAHPREWWTPLAWELQLQETPSLHCMQQPVFAWLSISAICPGKGFFSLPSQSIQSLWWDALGHCGCGSCEASRGGQKRRFCRVPASPSWCRRVCSHPVSKTKSLAPRGWAWIRARQCKFNPLSITLVLMDFSSSQGGDNAEPYNQLLDFPKLYFLALQFKFESCCLGRVCSSCFAMNGAEMKQELEWEAVSFYEGNWLCPTWSNHYAAHSLRVPGTEPSTTGTDCKINIVYKREVSVRGPRRRHVFNRDSIGALHWFNRN